MVKRFFRARGWKRGALISLLAASATVAQARTWQTVTGQSFEAEFVRVDGANGIFRVKAKDYPYPLNRLTAADRLFIGRITNHEPAAAAVPVASGPPSLGGVALKLGGETEVEIAVTDPAQLHTLEAAYGKPSTKARLLIAVPNDFAPAGKSYPLLLPSGSADGNGSSIAAARAFVPAALGKGFVLLAVDGEFGQPGANDSTVFRAALTAAALDAIAKEWPGAESWSIATGGVKGGGGYASDASVELAGVHRNVIGVFLQESAWSPANFLNPADQQLPADFRQLPIFLCANDNVAIKPAVERAHANLLRDRFSNVRFAHFTGGEELARAQLAAALAWFLSQSKK
jgi:hypothetical protein